MCKKLNPNETLTKCGEKDYFLCVSLATVILHMQEEEELENPQEDENKEEEEEK